MKLIRLLVIGLILFVVLAGIGIWRIDSIAAASIERGGSFALGTETRLESAEVGLLDGSFALSGLTVRNPPGFEAEHFLSLDSGRVSVDVGSLLSDRVLTERLELEGITVSMEGGEQGTNYGVILQNLERLSGEDAAEGAAPGGKSFAIDAILIRSVEANLRLGFAGASTSASVKVPEILLEDLDQDFTMPELISTVVRAILEHVVRNGGADFSGAALQDLAGRLSKLGDVDLGLDSGPLGEKVDELRAAGEDLEKLGDDLKGLFDRE